MHSIVIRRKNNEELTSTLSCARMLSTKLCSYFLGCIYRSYLHLLWPQNWVNCPRENRFERVEIIFRKTIEAQYILASAQLHFHQHVLPSSVITQKRTMYSNWLTSTQTLNSQYSVFLHFVNIPNWFHFIQLPDGCMAAPDTFAQNIWKLERGTFHPVEA